MITVNWNATSCTSAGSAVYTVFSGCLNLSVVNIGENVTVIPAYAFIDCTGLVYDEKGEKVTDYEDFHIRYVSKSTGDYNNVFYKFKVIDPQHKLFNLANAYAEKYGCRRYDIAGIYLKTDKSDVTFDKNIGRTFKCSGYIAG